MRSNAKSMITEDREVGTRVRRIELATGYTRSSGTPVPNFADAEAATGSGTAWTLAHAPSPTASLLLVDAAGKVLMQGTDYTLSGTDITTSSPATALTAWYRY